jgi:hypothetical protein
MYQFKEDDFVEFDIGEVKGCGYIRGIAAEPVAVIGATYIVQWESLRGLKHEYSCIPVFEHFIKKVED